MYNLHLCALYIYVIFKLDIFAIYTYLYQSPICNLHIGPKCTYVTIECLLLYRMFLEAHLHASVHQLSPNSPLQTSIIPYVQLQELLLHTPVNYISQKITIANTSKHICVIFTIPNLNLVDFGSQRSCTYVYLTRGVQI